MSRSPDILVVAPPYIAALVERQLIENPKYKRFKQLLITTPDEVEKESEHQDRKNVKLVVIDPHVSTDLVNLSRIAALYPGLTIGLIEPGLDGTAPYLRKNLLKPEFTQAVENIIQNKKTEKVRS